MEETFCKWKILEALVLEINERDFAENSRGAIRHWSIEVFFKDSKQLLGLGQYQNVSYEAAVTRLHLNPSLRKPSRIHRLETR